ncbi:MAG: ABC transporter ATP-binding protein [Byssovorax sp.]
MSEPAPLLAVRDLSVSFDTEGGRLKALDRVSITVPQGGSVALVGESGCGKSVTAQAILRLLQCPPARIDGGEILLEGRDLLKLPEKSMREVRGGKIGMVFQDPMTALNPVYSIGFQLMEAIRLHRPVSRSAARQMAIDGLKRVGLPDPEARIDDYPHELSGGMRQRVLIAIALAVSPALLIADEPTTALDATIQAQILELVQKLRDELSMSLLLIAHDLGVVATLADEIVVLYAGVVMEQGPSAALLKDPRHPYTRALLQSLPPIGPAAYRGRGQKGRRLPSIEGSLPDLRSPPAGCRFAPRCPEVIDRCHTEAPPLVQLGKGAASRCWLAGSVPALALQKPSGKNGSGSGNGSGNGNGRREMGA